MHARHDSATSETRRLWQPRKVFIKSLRTTKPVVVVRVRWRIVVAIRDPHVLGCIVPGTAAQDTRTSAKHLMHSPTRNDEKQHAFKNISGPPKDGLGENRPTKSIGIGMFNMPKPTLYGVIHVLP